MSNIQWCDETWNPIVGCSRVSPGCQKCYAAVQAASPRLQQFPQYQKVKDWDGTVEFVESQLLKPLGWKKPKKVFVCSMSDLFHKNAPDEWRDRIFAVMAIANQHTYQVLTKRPERMLEYFSDRNRARWIADAALDILRNEENPTIWKYEVGEFRVTVPLPNVWLGTTTENQAMFDFRVPLLLQTPAVIRFLSCEPLLEDIDMFSHINKLPESTREGEWPWKDYYADRIHWAILGGESGSDARECRLEWLRSILKQCRYLGIRPFVKQLGSNCIDEGKRFKTSDRKGGNIEEFPKDLRVREMPTISIL